MLSAFGIYGLISFVAASRTREVGIRMALGATRKSIVRLVVSEGMRLTSIGAIAGVAASGMVGRLLAGMLFRVRAFDWETVGLSVLVLGLVTTIAALVPAWRTARVEPMIALRTE